ncbi:hypothetical protein ACNHUP_004473 [Serratia marcescens]
MDLFSVLRWYLVLEPYHALAWYTLLVLCVAGAVLVVCYLPFQALFSRTFVCTLKGGSILLGVLFLGGMILFLPAEIPHALSRWRSEFVVALVGENQFLPSTREPKGNLPSSQTTANLSLPSMIPQEEPLLMMSSSSVGGP